MSKFLTDAERKEKEEKRNDLITRAETVVNTAKAEKRELTPDEMQELAEIRDDVRKIKEFLKLDDDFREMGDSEKKPDPEPKEDVSVDVKAEDRECKEKRAIEEQERQAFEAYIRNTLMNTRDTNLTIEDNGAVVPQTIADKIIRRVYDICPILEKSSKYNIKGTLTIPYYDESETAINVGYQTEFTQIASSVGQFTSNVTLTGYLAGALAKVSRSLIHNSQFNIVDHVVDLMAEHIARFIEHELLVGTPANPDATPPTTAKVLGLSTLTNVVTATATNAITADEVIKLHDAVKDRFQNNAMWIMSPATRTALRLLKDDMGRYMLQDDISLPFGTSLLGKPVYVSDNMPEIGAGAGVIYYGDFKGLATKFSENINIQVLRERYADEHADGVIGWFEFDSKVENAQMMAVLKMASN
jgi:HK97 family phage major capsid protein